MQVALVDILDILLNDLMGGDSHFVVIGVVSPDKGVVDVDVDLSCSEWVWVSHL